MAVKDEFNSLDRKLGKVSKIEFIDNLSIKERLMDNRTKSILLIDYSSDMKKLLTVKDVIKALGGLGADYIDWLDIVTCFIEDSKKREIMKGFLDNSSLTNELNEEHNKQYHYDIEDVLRKTDAKPQTLNPNTFSVNVDPNYARFMKQSADAYQFKLSEVDVGLDDEFKLEAKITVS